MSLSRTPLIRHLDDAKRMACSERVPDEVRQRVVPTLCRGAVEAACAELVRARVATDGLHASDADARLVAARTLRELLVLALVADGEDHTAITARTTWA